jgi:hypothetical protein
MMQKPVSIEEVLRRITFPNPSYLPGENASPFSKVSSGRVKKRDEKTKPSITIGCVALRYYVHICRCLKAGN